MDARGLEKLHAAIEWLLRQESFSATVGRLHTELDHSAEPFVWATIPLETIPVPLPPSIESCWLFLLKRNVSSGSHYHPNSIQHMVVLNGEGRSHVGGIERPMVPFGSARHSIQDKWHIIDSGVPHEFFPRGEDMAVVSFHTCPVDELVEIESGSGERRLYAPHG